MTDNLRDDLTRDLNALRAAASRGPVTSREIFQMTDGMMDRLSRAALAAPAPQHALPTPAEPAGDALREVADDLLRTVYNFINCWKDPYDDKDAAGNSLYDKETRTNVRLLGASADKLRAALAAAPASQPAPADREALVEALRAQRQADADGTMVTVSRQAVDEAISLLARPAAPLNCDDGVLYQAMNDGYGRYEEFKRDVLAAFRPAPANRETLAWAVVGVDGAVKPSTLAWDYDGAARHEAGGEETVRVGVSIRVLDDAEGDTP